DRERSRPRADVTAALAGHRAVAHGARAVFLAVEHPVAPRRERGRHVGVLSIERRGRKQNDDESEAAECWQHAHGISPAIEKTCIRMAVWRADCTRFTRLAGHKEVSHGNGAWEQLLGKS